MEISRFCQIPDQNGTIQLDGQENHGCMAFENAKEKGTAMDDQKMIELIIKIEPMLYRIAKYHLKCREDREDAVQECLYKVWKNRNELRQPQFFCTWVVRILKNECMTIGRKLEKKADWLDEDMADVQMDIEQRLEYKEIYRVLEMVPEESKHIIFLRFYDGYKYKEIAQMRSIPLGTVVSRMHRSLQHVRKLLSA